MGMFDYFVPRPALICPLDGAVLDGRDEEHAWQGKSGPCLLSFYRQGDPGEPTLDTSTAGFEPDDPDDPSPPRRVSRADELPDRFEIYRWCADHELVAEGRFRDGAWVETKLLYVMGPAPSSDEASSDVPARTSDGRPLRRRDVLLWGERPDKPLWPYDATERLSASLSGLAGFIGVSFLRETAGFGIRLEPDAPPATREAIPTSFAGRPVQIGVGLTPQRARQ